MHCTQDFLSISSDFTANRLNSAGIKHQLNYKSSTTTTGFLARGTKEALLYAINLMSSSSTQAKRGGKAQVRLQWSSACCIGLTKVEKLRFWFQEERCTKERTLQSFSTLSSVIHILKIVIRAQRINYLPVPLLLLIQLYCKGFYQYINSGERIF